MVNRKASLNEISQIAQEEGMVTLRQDGMNKVLEGITTIEEVTIAAQEQETYA